MRIGSYSILFAALLILVSCFPKLSAQTSHEPSRTNQTFDIAQAMRMLYGNYDVKKQISVASLPKDKLSLPGAGEGPLTVRPLFHAFLSDGGVQSFMLVTYAVPPAYGCHGCAPVIGMAVYSQKGLNWKMDASNRAVTLAGGWGEPPKDVKLVQIGPNRHGVQVTDVGGGQGETTTVLKLLIPWNGAVNLGLERIVADDDSGDCGPEESLPCYANRRTLTFIPNEKGEYYNLELKLMGTDLPVSDADNSKRARKVTGVESLKFENGKYVQISRQGDLTNADHAAAEWEGLK